MNGVDRQPGPRAIPAGAARSRRCSLLVVISSLALATSAGTAHAIGFDEIAQQSALGEPLRLVIPVLSTAQDTLSGDEFAGECFKLVPSATNDLPQLNSARIALEHRGGRTSLVLTTAQPIEEPIMRIAVRAGCRESVSREYIVLFDPVAVETAAVEAPASLAEARTPRYATGSAPSDSTTPSGIPLLRQDRAERTAPRSNATASTPPLRHPRGALKSSSAKPRLLVSPAIGDAAVAPVADSASSAAAELHAIEEQTVVLQKQIAELSRAMEQMQQELAAARAARAEAEKTARLAVERVAAAATPWGSLRAWAEVNWPLLVLLPALLVLLAALVHQRRRPVLIPQPLTATQAEAFNPEDLGEPSVPRPESSRDDEIVVGTMPVKPRPRMTPRAMVGPPVPELESEPELAFESDIVRMAEQSSAYSTLEREQPGIVARLTDSWGTPKAAQQLETYLLTPRHGGRALSRKAIEELSLLQTIVGDHARPGPLATPNGDRTLAGFATGRM